MSEEHLLTATPLVPNPSIPEELDLPRRVNPATVRPGRTIKPDQISATANVPLQIRFDTVRSVEVVRLTIQNNSSAAVFVEWGPDLAPPVATPGSFSVAANGGFLSADVLLRSLSLLCTQNTTVNGIAAGVVVQAEM